MNNPNPPPIDIFASDLRPMTYWHVRATEKLDQWKTGIPEGRSTGFRNIDKFRRLINGELTLIAARPSMGKTALGMQMVESMARQMQQDGEPGCVAVFSAEMGGWALYVRMAAARANVSTHKLQSGKATADEIARFEDAMQTIRTLPIQIDDNTGPTTGQMLNQLAFLNQDIPVRAMLFDYAELGGDRALSEEKRISSIAHNLKGIAKTLEIPVIALSQLNRDVEDRKSKMPTLSDLRYSGALEQIADVVMFIMRPDYYTDRGETVKTPDGVQAGAAVIQIAKNRNGPVGRAQLAFLKDRVQFGDLADEILPGIRR